MIANLPLLFTRGNPICLSKMVAQELECFITFLVHCSWGRDTAKTIQQPAWWPADVKFSNPFHRPPNVPKDWAERLRELIKSCYVYHSSEYLLKFSEQLAKNPPESLRYVDNCDRTTSLYQRPSGRLLVTFRNENIFYDRKNDSLSRKCLMPQRANTSESMVEPMAPELYLCDTCDEVFDNLSSIQEHEKLCAQRAESPEPRPITPDPPVRQEVDKDKFLNILGLQLQNASQDTTQNVAQSSSPHKNEVRPRRSVFGNLSYFPFSSLAGKRINRGHTMPKESAAWQREHLERLCPAPAFNMEQPKWLHKRSRRCFPNRYKRTENYWNRRYTFTGQRGKHVLDLKSQLNFLKCKPVYVLVERLTEKFIENYILECAKRAKERLLDNDIEFVSETVCSPSLRQCIISKRRSEGKLDSSSCSVVLTRLSPARADVIDLCSEDEDSVENSVPFPVALHASNELLSLGINLAAIPHCDNPVEPGDTIEAAKCNSLPRKRSHCGNLTNIEEVKEKISKLKEISISHKST